MKSTVAHRRVGAGLLAALIGLTPYLAFAQGRPARGSVVEVNGAGKTADGQPVNFEGTLDVQRFQVVDNPAAGTQQIVAIGKLTGKVTDASSGKLVKSVANLDVAAPVAFDQGGAAAQGVSVQQISCEILHLVLGPLDLNLLGLEIHLDTVDLLIEATPAGGLLGQLLCAVANLLSGGGLLSQIADLLNQILALLNP